MPKKQTETKKTTKKVEKISKKEQEIIKAKKLLTNNGIIIAENGEVIVDQVGAATVRRNRNASCSCTVGNQHNSRPKGSGIS